MELTKKQQAADQLFDALVAVFASLRFDPEDHQAVRIVGLDDENYDLGQRIQDALDAAGYDFADLEDNEAEVAPPAPASPA